MIFVAALTLATSCEKEPQIPVTPPSHSTEQDKKKAEEEAEKKRIEQLIAGDKDYDAKVSLLEVYREGGSGFTPYYYWYTAVADRNAKLKPYEYGSIYSWFDALLYNPTDRWSWMEDKESYVAAETGTSFGPTGTWGISVTQHHDLRDLTRPDDGRVFVSRVFPGAPLEKFGVTRGAQLVAIGNLEIPNGFGTEAQIDEFYRNYETSPMNFTFRLADGRDTSFTAEMSYSLKTNYILKTDIFTGEDFPGLTEPVGYFHYLSFNANKEFLDDVKEEMAKFKEAGVHKMIVDLRYNGGGDSRASDLLMSYLAPADAAGKPYVTRKHNSIVAQYQDQTNTIPEGNSLGLDEVFFIMHYGSASASEMTFNGLKPYLKDKVHHVGGQSYGKPNGMYVFFYPPDDDTYDRVNAGDYSTLKYVFYPICFFNFNSDGEGIPSTAEAGSGFVPDYAVSDDIYHDFGPQEADVKACLNYIVNGTFESADADSTQTKAFVRGRGIKAIFSEAETNPHYGTYTLPLPKEFRKQ